jgi:cytochrome o ubiquinol oxidase subunit 2
MVGLVIFAYIHRADLILFNPQGPVAFQERGVIIITVALAAIVVVPLFILLFVFAWKYRAGSPKAHLMHDANWDHDSLIAELVWWLVPLVIIIFLGLLAWKTSHDLDPYRPLASNTPTMTIEVVALDWKWLFIYPQQGIATVNMVEFPQNTPVRFEITADAPMNQFWIPSLGGQIMAMPGMTTQLNLLANQTGTYKGLSSEISGNGFAGMNFTAKSVSQSDFNAWVSSVQQMNTPLNATTYAALAKSSTNNPVSYYSSIDNQLYNTIIMNYMVPMQSKATVSASTTTVMPSRTAMPAGMKM